MGFHRRKRGTRPSIVYDPFREELSRETISEAQQGNYEKVTVEGTSNPVCIYLEIGEGSAKCRTLLARVDLGQLGFSEWIRRHTGNTQEIWVKGKVPSSIIRERTSWPVIGKSGYGLETPIVPQRSASHDGIPSR